ncbi:SapC family protein [uncultured Maricaulis sp.]|uniref:SapC family protein n=1 Tax=uncultured Maricaulis sp. TaxID=174710 RepID=UPI00262CEC4D|nr:SapC family protein [uncultured Maricaulis sp.]
MVDAAATEPRLTGTVPLYKNVEPLNRQKHATYGVNTVTQPFNFLKEWHFVPAISAEFAFACGSYPIIFLGEKKMPVLVMGLRQGSNLFVTEDGQFDNEHYIPAYVRRYPFVSAANPNDQPSTVCVDLDADFVVSENPERPFFDANGEPTDYTQQAIDFVSAFENDAKTTEAFVERLIALDLLEKKDVKVSNPQDPDNPVTVAEYFGVSSEKFDALPADKLKEMQTNGDLGAIVSHIISLQRWERILRRTSSVANAAASAQA